ncbi:hypothetical protein SK128_014311 [Halocaridina rubra]|uniref:Uncharacterized protein n=1 Tax=Halocaridina rubra TaxID=373956 RepID=A0AAN9A3P0_HALRR
MGNCDEATCSRTIAIDYIEDIVKLVLLHGLADEEIRKEVLGTTDIDIKILNETVDLVDSKKAAVQAIVIETPRVAATNETGPCSCDALPHPTLNLKVAVDGKAYTKMRISSPSK